MAMPGSGSGSDLGKLLFCKTDQKHHKEPCTSGVMVCVWNELNRKLYLRDTRVWGPGSEVQTNWSSLFRWKKALSSWQSTKYSVRILIQCAKKKSVRTLDFSWRDLKKCTETKLLKCILFSAVAQLLVKNGLQILLYQRQRLKDPDPDSIGSADPAPESPKYGPQERKKPVLRIRIRCLFDPWIRDPGWVESQHPDPGSGMNNPDHIF